MKVISLGWGVQSFALAAMSALRPFAEMNQTIEKHGSIPRDWVLYWADLTRADEVLNGGTDDD